MVAGGGGEGQRGGRGTAALWGLRKRKGPLNKGGGRVGIACGGIPAGGIKGLGCVGLQAVAEMLYKGKAPSTKEGAG